MVLKVFQDANKGAPAYIHIVKDLLTQGASFHNSKLRSGQVPV